MDTPEFSRCLKIDEIGAAPLTTTLAATPDECAALAARFNLVAVDSLTATAQVMRREAHIIAEGTFDAHVTQQCVATGEPVPCALHLPIKLRFIDESIDSDTTEIEVNFYDYDDMPQATGHIDLGEAAAQSMALALPPFPRGPHAARRLREAGVVPEGEEARGAFAGLKDLLTPPRPDKRPA